MQTENISFVSSLCKLPPQRWLDQAEARTLELHPYFPRSCRGGLTCVLQCTPKTVISDLQLRMKYFSQKATCMCVISK